MSAPFIYDTKFFRHAYLCACEDDLDKARLERGGTKQRHRCKKGLNEGSQYAIDGEMVMIHKKVMIIRKRVMITQRRAVAIQKEFIKRPLPYKIAELQGRVE